MPPAAHRGPPLLLIVLTLIARLSWYSPSTCPTAPVNCWNPSEWWKLANGVDYRTLPGHILACPPDFALGSRWHIHGSRFGLADGDWRCFDRGGAVVTEADGSVVLDLLRDTPVWGERLTVTVEYLQSGECGRNIRK